MTDGPAWIAFLAWIILVPLLFRSLGPARASAFAILGGFLLLPRVVVFLGPIPIDKRVAGGIALAAGLLLFDARRAFRSRPGWLDLPILAFVLAPLAGLATGVAGSGPDGANMIFQRVLGILAPYVAARLYFSDPDGSRRAAVAIVVAGLAAIPIILYEQVAGPARYLSTLLYGTHPIEGQVDRLGGYRPEGFLENGLEMASWMAMASTMGAWLWLGPGTGSRLVPAWLAASALVAASISCRGVYGLITLALGIATAISCRLTRSRLPLVALATIALLYMAGRGSGAWDGRVLDRAATAAGRPGTVGFRLDAEDEVIGRVLGRAPAFGFGNYVWHSAETLRWPDGQWLHLLWSGGLIGLGIAVVGLRAFPAALALGLPRRRPSPAEASSPIWALGCWSALGLIEMLHNASPMGPTGFVAGTIVGAALAPARPATPASLGRSASAPGRARSIAPVVVTAAVLLVVELIGRLSRTAETSPAADPSPPTSEAPR